MASAIIFVATFACLLATTIVLGDDNGSSPANELHYNGGNQDSSIQPSSPAPHLDIVPTQSPVNPSNNSDDDDDDTFDNNNNRFPFNNNGRFPFNNNNNNNNNGRFPLNNNNNGLFQPDRRPINPNSLFGSILGGDFFDSFRRHSDIMDKQFQELEQEASQGQSVSYFSRNGVSYMKTCTTKRV